MLIQPSSNHPTSATVPDKSSSTSISELVGITKTIHPHLIMVVTPKQGRNRAQVQGGPKFCASVPLCNFSKKFSENCINNRSPCPLLLRPCTEAHLIHAIMPVGTHGSAANVTSDEGTQSRGFFTDSPAVALLRDHKDHGDCTNLHDYSKCKQILLDNLVEASKWW